MVNWDPSTPGGPGHVGGGSSVCNSLCQVAEILADLDSLRIVVVVAVVEVVGVEPIHMEPRFVSTHSTCAICSG